MDGRVDPEHIDSGLGRIGRELAARAFGKADDGDVRMARLQPVDNRRGRRDHPAFELIGREAARPAIEQLDRLHSRLDLAAEIIEIGRASCRARVCQYVSISVVADSLKKKKNKK